MKESSGMVLDALNVGMLMMNRSPEDEIEKAVMAFVTHYGLLGLSLIHISWCRCQCRRAYLSP